jgi:hypothetical protein
MQKGKAVRGTGACMDVGRGGLQGRWSFVGAGARRRHCTGFGPCSCSARRPFFEGFCFTFLEHVHIHSHQNAETGRITADAFESSHNDAPLPP